MLGRKQIAAYSLDHVVGAGVIAIEIPRPATRQAAICWTTAEFAKLSYQFISLYKKRVHILWFGRGVAVVLARIERHRGAYLKRDIPTIADRFHRDDLRSSFDPRTLNRTQSYWTTAKHDYIRARFHWGCSEYSA